MNDNFHTFVINLDRSPARLATFTKGAEGVGLDFERMPAVDGLSVPDGLWHHFQGSPLTAGEVGCYASHMKCWQAILDRKLPWALVLEDDAILADDLVRTVAATLRKARTDWHIIKLCNEARRGVVRFARIPNRDIVRFVRQPASTVGYLISNEGAAQMLYCGGTVRTCAVDVDMRMAWHRDLNVLGVVPPPVTFTRDSSDVGARSTHGISSRELRKRDFAYARERVGLLRTVACLALPIALKAVPKRWRPNVIV